ncbi:hypothetical protein H6F98_02595 [Microcoleus sp. FACHB-SPT15]|uniref:hypothetical protein n=1 Tax=Microcoleus sp. FACHB-SPT15 TaxID=2692830 RepID=UPI00177B5D39|nr:hypothetical protein [Microcoleus sp. FACHB-SPT15]MBD1804360.1 hypothetical protein [Microcoleus sp. FACHB-SPT15]
MLRGFFYNASQWRNRIIAQVISSTLKGESKDFWIELLDVLASIQAMVKSDRISSGDRPS